MQNDITCSICTAEKRDESWGTGGRTEATGQSPRPMTTQDTASEAGGGATLFHSNGRGRYDDDFARALGKVWKPKGQKSCEACDGTTRHHSRDIIWSFLVSH